MLAHDLIRKDIELVSIKNNKHYTSEQIQNTVNWLKHQIYNKLDGKTVGKVVYINTDDFLITIAGMRAVWELGAAIWLNDTDPKVKTLPYFKKFYELVDLALSPDTDSFLEKENRKIVITDFDPTVQYTEFYPTPDQAVTEDTICYYALSSGTTGDPKALPHTHYQAVVISNFMKDYLGLSESSRPLHYKTLHHSSLFNSYALPLLNSCQLHHGDIPVFAEGPAEVINNCSRIMSDLELTNFLVPYNWIKYFGDIDQFDFKNNLTISCIADCDYDKMQFLFNKLNVKQVVNYFGCSEIGTMFLAKITHDNVAQYTAQQFNDVMPYLDYELFDEYVLAKWKHQTEWITLKDKITKEGDRIWFHGRSLLFESNGQQITLSDLETLIKDHLQTSNFTLVPDYKNNKLYLATYNYRTLDLNSLNSKITQAFGSDFTIADSNDFYHSDVLIGMKSSLPFLQWFFQNKS